MKADIKCVHVEVDDLTKELIDKKLEKVSFADDKVQDLEIVISREKDHMFALETKVHFRWGVKAVIKYETYELKEGIDTLIDKLDLKIRKEVEKIQDR